jgi:hypothetical protein
MSPKIGEIKRAKDIGGKGYNRRIWAACVDCGFERWVDVDKGRPRRPRCKTCGGKLGASYLQRRCGKDNPSWKGGRIVDGGYIRIHKPGHPRANQGGYVLEHILVWEKTHHRPLPAGWVIHHLNGTKRDNRPVNLLGLLREKHHTELVNQALKRRIRELEKRVNL